MKQNNNVMTLALALQPKAWANKVSGSGLWPRYSLIEMHFHALVTSRM
jgi:hypothetical protein